MEYRGYFYKEIEVKDYNGNRATMFKCSDVDLLEHTDTSSFTKFTEESINLQCNERIFTKITRIYIDNIYELKTNNNGKN